MQALTGNKEKKNDGPTIEQHHTFTVSKNMVAIETRLTSSKKQVVQLICTHK